MMLRIVAVVSLSILLVLVLWLPAAHPPQVFMAQIRAEHALNDALWGREHAVRIMSRMLAFVEAPPPVPPMPVKEPARAPADAAVGAQMAQMTTRLLDN